MSKLKKGFGWLSNCWTIATAQPALQCLGLQALHTQTCVLLFLDWESMPLLWMEEAFSGKCHVHHHLFSMLIYQKWCMTSFLFNKNLCPDPKWNNCTRSGLMDSFKDVWENLNLSIYSQYICSLNGSAWTTMVGPVTNFLSRKLVIECHCFQFQK